MITKAYIINKEQNSNKYDVRIPIFEKPGINSENSNLSRTHFSATLAHEPTIFDAYNIGDCVFVGFENNELNRPVIIGKLYTKNDTSATSGLIETKVLKVLDKVTLPADTTIGGINFSNISNFFNSINDILNKKDINPPASAIITDVSQFNGILSSDDVNVQHALETLDNHTHVLPIASDTVLGAIKIGDGLNVAPDGTVSVTAEASGVKIIVSNIQPDIEALGLRNGDFWYEYD